LLEVTLLDRTDGHVRRLIEARRACFEPIVEALEAPFDNRQLSGMARRALYRWVRAARGPVRVRQALAGP
jgi:hypothetical protein